MGGKGESPSQVEDLSTIPAKRRRGRPPKSEKKLPPSGSRTDDDRRRVGRPRRNSDSRRITRRRLTLAIDEGISPEIDTAITLKRIKLESPRFTRSKTCQVIVKKKDDEDEDVVVTRNGGLPILPYQRRKRAGVLLVSKDDDAADDDDDDDDVGDDDDDDDEFSYGFVGRRRASTGRKESHSSTSSSFALPKGLGKLASFEKATQGEGATQGKQTGRCPSDEEEEEQEQEETKKTSSSIPTVKSKSVGRNIEKQKIRDQLKQLLLGSGWTIDLRPRRNRNYEDSVYISPQGTGYWSITKAYKVFLEQKRKREGDERNNDEEFPQNQVNGASGKNQNLNMSSSFAPISVDLVGLLKRKTVLGRKRVKGIEKSKTSGSNKSKITPRFKIAKNRNDTIASRDRSRSSISNSRPSLGRKKKNQRRCPLLIRKPCNQSDSEDDGYIPYDGKRTILGWMIDSGTLHVNGKVKYLNKGSEENALEGFVTRDGIHCSCCSKILAPSEFEIHAGSDLSQPYQHIFVEESGFSLLQCQLSSWKNLVDSERFGFLMVDIKDDDPNDDTCGICGDGGDLICCDGCPSTFHLSCLGIQKLPLGDWHCSNCTCKFCGEVDNSFSEGDADSSTVLSCSQCEEKYHPSCILEDIAPDDRSSTADSSFCGKSCFMLFQKLHKLVGYKNELGDGFSWSLVQRLDKESGASLLGVEREAECNSKVAVSLAIMNECFLPVIDQRSGINLINNVVYNFGSNFNRLNYSGFYTFVLERGDEMISAASIRFHGTKLVEMPFIGTRDMYRRQGMCRRLLNALETVLSSLSVEKLVIPAISELMHTWTMVFNFGHPDDPIKEELKSLNLLVFPGTGLLVKSLLKQENAGSVCIAHKSHQVLSGDDSKKMSTLENGTLCSAIMVNNFLDQAVENEIDEPVCCAYDKIENDAITLNMRLPVDNCGDVPENGVLDSVDS